MSTSPPPGWGYPSDVCDDEWELVVPYLTLLPQDALQRRYDLRAVFNAARWIAHTGALYLIYTRRGAANDHVFRHRAPIFIAQVDPDRLCVQRATEQVLMPESGLDLGAGFAPVDVNGSETWVISSETAFPKERQGESNHVLLAKIIWSKP